MRSFTYTQLPGRVVFGVGALDHLPREIELLGATRALVLSTPEQEAQAEDVAKRLGTRCAGMFPRAVMHVPIEVARAARDEAKRLGADCAVAIGGGSTTGLGKAIALESALPILAIPTTYAGSEMTPIYGLRSDVDPRPSRRPLGHQRLQRDRACGRGTLCRGRQSDHEPDGRGRDPRPCPRPAGHREEPQGSRGT